MEFTVRIRGTRDRIDKRIAMGFLNQVNAERQAEADRQNEGKTEDDPTRVEPELLPSSNNQEIYDGYEIYLSGLLASAHEDYRDKAGESFVTRKELKEFYQSATEADLQQLTDLIRG